MKNRLFILIAFLSFYCANILAQAAMGQWRTHFAYNSVVLVEQTTNRIFAVSGDLRTDGSLFSVDKLDGNIEIHSRLTGLNGNIVSAIRYDAARSQLIIGYNNGNIDIITNRGVVNIPDFHNQIMTVDKTINHIMVYGDRAYLSCNFGIIVLNLQRREIAETYYIGANASEVNVINTTVHNNEIFALTYTGSGASRQFAVFRANLSNPNLVDFRNWSQLPTLPTGNNQQAIVSFAGELFMQNNGRLFKYDNGNWTAFPLPNNAATSPGISISQNRMIVANNTGNVFIIDDNLNITHLQNVVNSANAGVFDSRNNTFWFAGGEQGVVSYNTRTEARNAFMPSGPAINTPWNMTFAGEKLFVVPGRSWGGTGNEPAWIMIFENGRWTNIRGTNPYINSGLSRNFANVAVSPFDPNHYFVTSFFLGLNEYRGTELTMVHHANNSLLETQHTNLAQFFNDIRISGATFDGAGNLWLLNSLAQRPIKIFTRDRKWLELRHNVFPPRFQSLGVMHINKRNPNQKWFLSHRTSGSSPSTGIGVFEHNGDMTNLQITQAELMSSFTDGDGETITPSFFFSIAQDHNGVIWVGTNEGPLLFDNIQNIFAPNYRIRRVIVPRNDDTGQGDHLLVSENIKAIAIDGANRKWLGTEHSGVYLMSADGRETIHHFTTENSPLPSNDIFSLAINPVSGEVFIGTSAGLVSFQSDAAHAGSSFGNVYAFPNPVRQNFHGVITITGLVHNTRVKITDLNGNLIAETVSNGSIATWDGRDGFGRRVSTGVYFAMCITEDGTDSTVTKIMVIN